MRNGFTLIELVVTLALVALVAVGMGSFFVHWNRGAQRQALQGTVQLLRQNALALLNDATAWDKTLGDMSNLSFACLQNLTDCSGARTSDPSRAFSLRDRSGTLFADAKDPAAGFTASGTSCTGFPGPACPLRLRLTWRADCEEGAPCVAPLVVVEGAFFHATDAKSPATSLAGQDFQVVKHLPGTAAGEAGEGFPAEMKAFCAMFKEHAGDPEFEGFLARELTSQGHADYVPMLKKLKESCK